MSIDEFKEIYKLQIKKNKTIQTMLKNLQDEQRLGHHNGILDLDEYSYLYLFLNWDNEKKIKKIIKREEEEAKEKQQEEEEEKEKEKAKQQLEDKSVDIHMGRGNQEIEKLQTSFKRKKVQKQQGW